MKIRVISSYKYELIEDLSVKLYGNFNIEISHGFFNLKNNILTIKKGYCWDGCSGIAIDTKSNMLAGLVHDVLYQSIRENLIPKEYKKLADKNLRYFMIHNFWYSSDPLVLNGLFLELIKINSIYTKKDIIKKIFNIFVGFISLGWMEFRANYFYYSVRAFGGSSIKPKEEANEKIIYVK